MAERKFRLIEGEKGKKVPPPAHGFIRSPHSGSRPPAVSEPHRVLRDRVVVRIRELASGWNDLVRKSLSIPGTLYLQDEQAGFLLYSSDPRFEISAVVQSLQFGTPLPPRLTEYGIAIYDRSSTTYLVLVDPQRRIIVRQQLSCLHSTPQQTEWRVVKEAIDKAVAQAKTREGTTIVDDGMLRTA